MEHIPQSNAEVFEKGAVTSWEYPAQSEAMNVAVIHINGRYPESGFTTNREVDSLVQVTDGSGILGMSDGTTIDIGWGDQIHLRRDDEYFFEGDLELVYAATPKWTPGQTERLE